VQASFLLPEALDLLNPAAVDLLAPALGLPAAPGTCALAVALAGSPETVERQAREFTALFEAGGGTALSLPIGQTGPAWHAIRNLLDGVPANPARILCKITVPIARTGDLAAAAGRAGQIAGLRATVVAHAGSGVIWALYLPGMETVPEEPVARALEGLRAEAVAAGGSLVLHDAPPPLKRQVDAWGAPGDGVDLMRRLKAEFDPRGLCNPGRFVGGI
jgi:FAD/FMN-containing dehydrogenase